MVGPSSLEEESVVKIISFAFSSFLKHFPCHFTRSFLGFCFISQKEDTLTEKFKKKKKGDPDRVQKLL